MRILILLLLPLYGISCLADTKFLEVIGGAMDYHLIGTTTEESQKFSNKWSSDGKLIGSKLFGFSFVTENKNDYSNIKVFVGTNSVGQSIGGASYSVGTIHGGWYTGLVAGGYIQDPRPFNEKEIYPYGIGVRDNVNLMPVAGFEINYKVKLGDPYYVKINNFLSPFLTVSYIILGWEID